MRDRELVKVAVAAALAGCGTAAAPPPVLSGAAPPAARVATGKLGTAAAPATPPPELTAPTDASLRCPLFPDGCLASDGPRPGDCAEPDAPAITFATGSAAIPRAEYATIDRVVQDSRRFADTTRLIITADAARLEPGDLAKRRVDAVKDALIARGLVVHTGIVTVTSAVYMLDELPEPPTNRVELALRGCR